MADCRVAHMQKHIAELGANERDFACTEKELFAPHNRWSTEYIVYVQMLPERR